MDIESMKSQLRIEHFFFSKCFVERELKVTDGELRISVTKKIQQVEEGEHRYDVTLQLNLEKEDLSIEIVANARFVFEAEDYSKEQEIVEHNTVAIMFPYLRTQATLLTSQPGMAPVVLPLINTNKF